MNLSKIRSSLDSFRTRVFEWWVEDKEDDTLDIACAVVAFLFLMWLWWL